jgi:O-antigen/teichoic acid export membrane protein
MDTGEANERENMSKSVRRAVLVTSSERYIVMTLNFALIAIASRLLTPSDIGVAALGLSLIMIAEALRDFGTSTYLVRATEITDTNARSAFTVALIISLLLAGIFFAASEPAATFYRDPRLGTYVKVLAVSIVFTPVSSTLLALLRRDMQFELAAIVTVGSVSVNAAVTLGLIALGFNYMSFAWAAMAQVVTAGLISLVLRPQWSVFKPHLGEWRSILAFGSALSTISIMARGYESLPLLVLGRIMPSDIVGLFSRSTTICQLSDKILLPSVANVTLPALATRYRSGHDLKGPFFTAVSYITVVQWPSLLLLAYLAQSVVEIILGQQWLSAVPLVQIMALATLLAFPAALPFSVLVTTGRINDMVRATLISLPACAALTITAALWGPYSLAASQFITLPLQAIVCLIFVRRQIGFAWSELGRVFARSALVSVLCVSAAVGAIIVTGASQAAPILEVLVGGLGALVGWLGAVFAFGHPIQHEVRLVLNALSRTRLKLLPT